MYPETNIEPKDGNFHFYKEDIFLSILNGGVDQNEGVDKELVEGGKLKLCSFCHHHLDIQFQCKSVGLI